MSYGKSPKTMRMPDETEQADETMLNELECTLARIDADLARILGMVESSHYRNLETRKKLFEVSELNELRLRQIWRAEGFDHAG